MEFIRGRTLEQFARQAKPSCREAALLVAKLARGLAVAHRCGIAHLDIKPSNVLVDDRGEPHLIDFGLAHLSDAWHLEVLDERSLRGTLCFMAPEQAQGRAADIDYRSDIFALGGLLFFMLTGSAPYPPGKFEELLQRVRACQWDQELLYHRHIPPRLRHCCLRAMAETPDRRFSGAEAFAKTLERFCHEPSHWRIAAGGAVATLLALGVSLALLEYGFPSGGSRSDPPVGRSGEPVSARPPQPSATVVAAPDLTVEAWESDRFRCLPECAPLRTGDQLRIVAKIPPGMYYSLFLLDSEGQFQALQEGRAGEEPLELRYPATGKAVPLIGPPGTELVVLCGRRSGGVKLSDLRGAHAGNQRLPALPGLSVLWLDRRGVSVLQRGRSFGVPADLPDPETAVRDVLESFHHRLAAQTDFFEALAFSHQ